MASPDQTSALDVNATAIDPSQPTLGGPQMTDQGIVNTDLNGTQLKPQPRLQRPDWFPNVTFTKDGVQFASEANKQAWLDHLSPQEMDALQNDHTGDALQSILGRDIQMWQFADGQVGNQKDGSPIDNALRNFQFATYLRDRGALSQSGTGLVSVVGDLLASLGRGAVQVGTSLGSLMDAGAKMQAMSEPMGNLGINPADAEAAQAEGDKATREVSTEAYATLQQAKNDVTGLVDGLGTLNTKIKNQIAEKLGFVDPTTRKIVDDVNWHTNLVADLDAQKVQNDQIKQLADWSGLSEDQIKDSAAFGDLFASPLNLLPIGEAFGAVGRGFTRKVAQAAFAPGVTEALRVELAKAGTDLAAKKSVFDLLNVGAEQGVETSVGLDYARDAYQDALDHYQSIQASHAASAAEDAAAIQQAAKNSTLRSAAATGIKAASSVAKGAAATANWFDQKLSSVAGSIVGDNPEYQQMLKDAAYRSAGGVVGGVVGSDHDHPIIGSTIGFALGGSGIPTKMLMAAGRWGDVLSNAVRIGETLQPLSRKFAQEVSNVPMPGFVANLLDPNVGSLPVRFAKSAVASAASGASDLAMGGLKGAGEASIIGGGLSYLQSGGDPDSIIPGAVQTGALGFFGGALGSMVPAAKNLDTVTRLNNESKYLQYRWGLDSAGSGAQNLARFKELDPSQQLMLAHVLHTNPDVSLLFTNNARDVKFTQDVTGKPPVAGAPGFVFTDPSTGQRYLAIDPTRPDGVFQATLYHELRHYMTGNPAVQDSIVKTLLGDPESGLPGLFTQRDEKGEPVANYDMNGRQTFTPNADFYRAKQEYVSRMRQLAPNFNISDRDFALEYDAETTAHRWMGGDFDELVRPTFSGVLANAMQDSGFVRRVMGHLGVSFDKDFNVAGRTSVVGQIPFSPALRRLTDHYADLWTRGLPIKDAEDDDGPSAVSVLKSGAMNDLLKNSVDVNRNPDGTIAGTRIENGRTVVVDPRKILKSQRQAQADLDAMRGVVEKAIADHANKFVGNDEVVQPRVQADNRAVMSGRYLADEHIADMKASGRFSPSQIEQIKNLNNLMKLNSGDFVRMFYQRPGNKANVVDSIKGHWREEVPYAWLISKQDNISVRTVAPDKFVNNIERLWAKDPAARQLWSSLPHMTKDAWDYLTQLSQKEDTEPTNQRNYLNGALGLKGSDRATVNPLFAGVMNKKLESFIVLRRMDRMNRVTPGVRDVRLPWSYESYRRGVMNMSPDREDIEDSRGLTIDKAAAGLEEQGYTLGKPLPWEKGKPMRYEVTDPTGKPATMTTDQIKGLIGGSNVQYSTERDAGDDYLRSIDAAGDKSATQVDPKAIKYPQNPVKDSVVLPPRWGLVNRNIVGMPRSFKDVGEIVDRAVSRMKREVADDPHFAKESARFYEDMATSSQQLADVVSPGVEGYEKAMLSDLMLRYLALGSPRTNVTGNATKSSGSASGIASGHEPGFKLGFGQQQQGAKETYNAWAKGGHFDLDAPGIDDKVRSFYINGLSELIEQLEKGGDDKSAGELLLRAGKSLHLVDPSTTSLTPDERAEIQRHLDGKATVDMWDMAGKGFAWPGFLMDRGERTNAKQPFQWSQEDFAKTSTLKSPLWKNVLADLSSDKRQVTGPADLRYQEARALRIDGNMDWTAKTWDERKQQPFDPSTEFTYFTRGTEEGLTPGGAGPMYDAQQAIDGIIADRLNAEGMAGQFGKEKLKARNAQEILWALEKLDNPVKANNDLSLYGKSISNLADEVRNLRQGGEVTKRSRAEAILAAMDRAYDQMARQEMPIEAVTSGTSDNAKLIQSKIAELQSAGDHNAATTVTESVARGLGDAINDLATTHGIDVTVDSVHVGHGGYTEGQQVNVSPNMRLVMRGNPRDTGRILDAISRALDQDGGNIIRKPTVRELNDAKVKKNTFVTFDTRNLSGPQKEAFFMDLAALKDSNGEPFLTGYTETGDGLAIGDQFYGGDMRTALTDNDANIKAVMAKHGVQGAKKDTLVVDTFRRGTPETEDSTHPFAMALRKHVIDRVVAAKPTPRSFPEHTDTTRLLEQRAAADTGTMASLGKTDQQAVLTKLKSDVDAALLRGQIDDATADRLKRAIGGTDNESPE
jgi:hypothetical protein